MELVSQLVNKTQEGYKPYVKKLFHDDFTVM
jgi:hypothetical protein